MIKYYCDLCGDEIPDSKRLYSVSIKDNRQEPVSTLEEQIICHDCLRWIFQRKKKLEQLKEQTND